MLVEMKFLSRQLGKSTQVNVLLPEGEECCRVLWLLHGLSDDHTAWMRYTSIERYAAEHRLAVVMPDTARCWYTDTAYGVNYFSYIAHELPELCRRTFRVLSDRREDNVVAGLSMGGYGALKLALTLPHQYGACISLSGALDITRRGRSCNVPEWRSIFGFDLPSPLSLEGSEHDLFALAKKNKAGGLAFPRTYLWCGESDELTQNNRDFSALLGELGVDHLYEESEGNHSWRWWDKHIQSGLSYVLGA